MRTSNILKSAALLSASVAVLSLGACNQNGAAQSGAAQNGAYVATAADEPSGPASGQGLPPSTQYQAVADTPPPALPVYDQPPMPDPGYIWTPGYWDWSDSDDDYYWVPGTWVEPPSPGLYWTPGYWRYYNNRYLFSRGYWGPQVGFYGGVDYGYGYVGNDYVGGRWQGGQLYYNTQVNNFGGVRVNTVYNQSAPAGGNRLSYNGGPGGLNTAPTQAQVAAAQTRHVQPAPAQLEQARMAQAEPQLRASVNRGSPPIAATARPAAFHTPGAVTSARSAGAYTPPARAASGPPQGPVSRETAGPEAPHAGPRADGAAPRGVETQRPVPAERPPAPVARPAPSVHIAPQPRPVPPPRATAPRPVEARPAAAPASAPRPAPHPQTPRPAEERRGPEAR